MFGVHTMFLVHIVKELLALHPVAYKADVERYFVQPLLVVVIEGILGTYLACFKAYNFVERMLADRFLYPRLADVYNEAAANLAVKVVAYVHR